MYHNPTRSRVCMASLLKLLFMLLVLLPGLNSAVLAADNNNLLPPEQAFIPDLVVHDQDIHVYFIIAEGYYLYQNKIQINTEPADMFGSGHFIQQGQQKNDEFFGTQQVYYDQAAVVWR